MDQLIIIDGLTSVSITSTAEARQTRESLLASSATVQEVTDKDGAEYAASMLKDIKAFTRLIDSTRVAVKAPVLDQGRRIDALAKELSTQLEIEASRISRLLGPYTVEQKRIAERVMHEAQMEGLRIIQENRAKAEALAAATPDKTEQDVAMDRLSAFTEQKLVEIRNTAYEKAPTKLAGTSTRTVIKFEVTAINVLHAAHPYLVVMTPNTSAINAILKSLPAGQELPGVYHWTENLVSVR